MKIKDLFNFALEEGFQDSLIEKSHFNYVIQLESRTRINKYDVYEICKEVKRRVDSIDELRARRVKLNLFFIDYGRQNNKYTFKIYLEPLNGMPELYVRIIHSLIKRLQKRLPFAEVEAIPVFNGSKKQILKREVIDRVGRSRQQMSFLLYR